MFQNNLSNQTLQHFYNCLYLDGKVKVTFNDNQVYYLSIHLIAWYKTFNRKNVWFAKTFCVPLPCPLYTASQNKLKTLQVTLY